MTGVDSRSDDHQVTFGPFEDEKDEEAFDRYRRLARDSYGSGGRAVLVRGVNENLGEARRRYKKY